MSREAIDEALSRVSYKRTHRVYTGNWTSRDGEPMIRLIVERWMNDSADWQLLQEGKKRVPTSFHSRIFVPWPKDLDELLQRVWRVIQWMELHEIAEWLRYDGKPLIHSHAIGDFDGEGHVYEAPRFGDLNQYSFEMPDGGSIEEEAIQTWG